MWRDVSPRMKTSAGGRKGTHGHETSMVTCTARRMAPIRLLPARSPSKTDQKLLARYSTRAKRRWTGIAYTLTRRALGDEPLATERHVSMSPPTCAQLRLSNPRRIAQNAAIALDISDIGRGAGWDLFARGFTAARAGDSEGWRRSWCAAGPRCSRRRAGYGCADGLSQIMALLLQGAIANRGAHREAIASASRPRDVSVALRLRPAGVGKAAPRIRCCCWSWAAQRSLGGVRLRKSCAGPGFVAAGS